ncbi:UvrD-helicase domain-containing protein [Nocardia sp. NPDC056100]|uniref:UvrD-helicase domain-containing protein n=1 Tax=Nocardia sp. NPDC056100 TaxID=3345712 RepID=UPI0035E02487
MPRRNPVSTLLIPPLLAADIRSLDSDQQKAVTTPGNVVIVAGPGSGKTRTLVARAGYLLCTQISPLRGLAAITYTNQAALELQQRLALLGVSDLHRLFVGTLHSFCLTQVLTYAELAGMDLPAMDSLMSMTEINRLRDECANEAGANRYALKEVFTTLRRRVVAGEDVSQENPANVAAIEEYERQCQRMRVWDFDAIVFKSVALLRDVPQVASIIKAKYPTILIDEYQDLGAALHSLVESLICAGVNVTAVGDADQSIFGFTGGDPRYLEELSNHEDFQKVDLTTNYRCGSAVIAAAEVALAQSRGWRADPSRRDPGTIEVKIASGDQNEQARQVCAAVSELLAAGVPPHEIGVLLRFRAPLAPLICAELTGVGIQVRLEGSSASLQSLVGKWISSCALYGSRLAQAGNNSSSAPWPKGVDDLLDQLDRLRSRAGYARSTAPLLEQIHSLHAILTVCGPRGEPYDVPTWTSRLTASLDLKRLCALLGDSRNLDELSLLLSAPAGQPLKEIANDLASTGRVSVGTYHSAKGRTFTAVLLPALTEGVVPPWGRDFGRPVPPHEMKVREERRNFYVALTRSSGAVLLYAATSGVDNRGERIDRGYSRFALELADRLHVAIP